jgi:poly-gamma-glutamate capsule biosynthesis protein CapA/YwtB (metallophosphatase superfamily)
MFAGCRAALHEAHLAFAQLETTVSDRGAPVPGARLAMRAPPAMLGAMRAAGFGVASFAGNHCLDYGYEAFQDTLAHAQAAGLALCGAGSDLDSARRPALLEIAGQRIAFIGASSILPEGYAATETRAGCAPLHAWTVYEQIEPDQPGTAARVRTFTNPADLAALCEAVRAASTQANWVIVSLHWGIHMIPNVLADYQRQAAHALIEAGAHAILGHHPHLLKGIEFHRGCPIFYSLGNFAIEQPHVWDPAITATASFRHLVSLNPAWQPGQSYMLPEITRATGLARLELAAEGVRSVRLLPFWAGDDSAPQPLPAHDARFERVRLILSEACSAAGLTTRVQVQSDTLLLTPA